MFILLPSSYRKNRHLLRKDLFFLRLSMRWSVFRIKINNRVCHLLLKTKVTASQRQRLRVVIDKNKETIEAYRKMLSRPI